MGDGAAVADQLNTLSGQLSTLESQVTSQYNTLTDPSTGAVANDANEIAQLNGQIAQAQSAGIDANALEDQRDNVIDDLSQYSNVNVTTQSNGMVNVSFGNAALAAQNGTTDATPLVNGTSVDLTDNLTDSNLSGAGGTLGSLLGSVRLDHRHGQDRGLLDDARRHRQRPRDHGQQRDLRRRRERTRPPPRSSIRPARPRPRSPSTRA